MKVSKSKRIIVVTGLPRSGTTVVGDVLSAGKKTTSLYEPMNSQSGDRRIHEIFPIVGLPSFSQAAFDTFVEDVRTLNLHLRSGVFPHEKGLRRAAKTLIGGNSRMSLRKARLSLWANTIIWKDPFASFCVDAFMERNIDVVITYRPPQAIAASYKRLNWGTPHQILNNRLSDKGWNLTSLLNTKPALDNVSPLIENAVYMWVVTTTYFLSLLDKPNPPLVVSTGELRNAPIELFNSIFSRINLAIDPKVKSEIEKRFMSEANPNQPAVPSGHPHTQKRNLSEVNTYWKQVLTAEEAKYIDTICTPLEQKIAPYLLRA